MDIFNIFTAFGLSSSAGLNAYIPLLMTGLMARYTSLITLQEPFTALENPWVLGTITILLFIEMLVDKIPALDSVNDLIHTFIRPAAGALLFAAGSGAVGQIDSAFAIILGLLSAGSIHATKTAIRPVVTASTAGIGNPVVSVIEDVIAFVATLLAIVVPVLMAIISAIVFLLIARWWWRRRGRERPV